MILPWQQGGKVGHGPILGKPRLKRGFSFGKELHLNFSLFIMSSVIGRTNTKGFQIYE